MQAPNMCRPSFFWKKSFCDSFGCDTLPIVYCMILMNLGRMDHFRNHRIEIRHDSEQFNKMEYHTQSLWKKMLHHFAKWSFFLLFPRRTGLHYTWQDWTRAKDCRSVLHNSKKNEKKWLYFVADGVKWHDANVWSTYRTKYRQNINPKKTVDWDGW